MGKRRNSEHDLVTWTPPMDDALIDAFLHQQDIGNRVNGSFTSKALDNILKELSDKYPDVSFDKEKIKNRMKYIKKCFGPAYDVFKNGLSGFSWNPVTCTWGAEPGVWKDLLKTHPEAKVLATKPVCNYWKLATLFGNYRATEEDSDTAAEIRERNARLNDEENEVQVGDTIEEIDLLVSQNQATLGGYDVNPESPLLNKVSKEGTSNKNRQAKKAKVDENFLRESFKIVADALKESTSELVKSNERFNERLKIPESEIWNYLEELQLEEHVQDKAYIYLTKNPVSLGAFLGCPSRRRKNILLEMLHDAKTI